MSYYILCGIYLKLIQLYFWYNFIDYQHILLFFIMRYSIRCCSNEKLSLSLLYSMPLKAKSRTFLRKCFRIVRSRTCGSFQQQQDNEQHLPCVVMWRTILCTNLILSKCGGIASFIVVKGHSTTSYLISESQLHTFFVYILTLLQEERLR